MGISRGHMVKAYVIYCSQCDECLCCESTPGNSVTLRECASFARDDGWIKTRKYGWVCPECLAKGRKKR